MCRISAAEVQSWWVGKRFNLIYMLNNIKRKRGCGGWYIVVAGCIMQI